MSHLPILIPGRTDPVNVPCSLPESMSLDVFLPDRGVRRVTAFWKSTDPLQIDYCTTTLANPETDIAHFLSDPYFVDVDEEQRMQDAAGDVLERVFNRLGIIGHSRRPVLLAPEPLVAIASAFLAECEAFEAVLAAHKAMPRAAAAVCLMADPKHGDSSACGLLSRYVEWAVEQACKAQDQKARRESEAHLPSGDEDAAGSERIQNEREVMP